MDQLNAQLRRIFLTPPHRLLLVGGIFLALLGGALAFQVVRAEDRILQNVSIGGVQVGGLTIAEASERLRTSIRAFNLTGLQFSNGGRVLTIKAEEAMPVDGKSVVILNYDVDAMVKKAFAHGHDEGADGLLAANLRAMFNEVMFRPEATLNEDALRTLLLEKFGDLEQPARDADVRVTVNKTTKTEIVDSASGSISVSVPAFEFMTEIVPETHGNAFDYGDALSDAADAVDAWRTLDYRFDLFQDVPSITTDKASGMRGRVVEILERGPLVLAYDDQKWEILPQNLAEIVTLKAWPDGSAYVGLKDAAIITLLNEAADTIESSAKPTKLELNENGRASKFEGGTVGKTVNRKATLAVAEERLNAAEVAPVPIAVDTFFASEKSSPIAEELGIRELVGYGTSNFTGSPKNRRINIANGAKLLDGWIIKPGEEVGLLEKLKPFNAVNGYLPELVIKEKRTVPEYGGGLCQIGTTTFRAVMGAGLPITQRRNHSYRVRYYEPAGTDATLYDPNPDFKFINDTANHILLKTKIVDNNFLRFEFWGTRDGRVQEQGKIRTTNITPAPKPNLIETSELAEGAKKCFETPHAGATTNFTYTITYPDGRVADKDFRSVYKPWQEQCLIGKAGAARIVIGKDGSIRELPAATTSASGTPATVPPAVQ